MGLIFYILFFLALATTFLYIHLMVTGMINSRLNPYSNGSKDDNAILVSKIKYVLLLIMALSWAGIITMGKI